MGCRDRRADVVHMPLRGRATDVYIAECVKFGFLRDFEVIGFRKRSDTVSGHNFVESCR